MAKQHSPAEEYIIAAVSIEYEIKNILCENLQNLPITYKMIKYETGKDSILQYVLKFLEND